MKCIRTYNGGEYSGLFDKYSRKIGIRHQKDAFKDSIVKRYGYKDKSNPNGESQMFAFRSKIAKKFLGEVLLTTIHVINLSPTIALNGDVPDRVWYGREVSYDHLQVFGCNAFVHIPKNERSKLDAKT